jgi:SAM-dependent methyltransferase
MSSDPLSELTQQNRRAWNEIAQVRSRKFPPAAFFAGGGSTLAKAPVEAVRSAFGSLAGLRLIHLQCATGEDTLSWAGLGVDACGVDISDEQIEIARQKAADSRLRALFSASDVYRLPGELPQGWLGQGFDVVYTGGGAIVWLPDLTRWANVVAALLKTAGRLVLHDEHPIGSCLSVENGQIQVVDDYFRRSNHWEVSGWYHFKGGEDAREIKYEFTWPIGDIVTAVAQAGLVIERLEEFPGGPEWRLEETQGLIGRLPGQYLLVARKQSEYRSAV